MLTRVRINLILVCLLALPLCIRPLSAAAPTLQDGAWMTDGPVNAIAVAPQATYIGGKFTHVGPYTGACAPLDGITAQLQGTFPRFLGEIYTIIPDGSGGWYVGGNFSVDGTTIQDLAHVRSDGSLDTAFHPNPDNGGVDALVKIGQTIYVGGWFKRIANTTQPNLAAVDQTGALLNWNPAANDSVFALATDGTLIYAAGRFSQIGGAPRANLAALDSSGRATTWTCDTSDPINSIVIAGNLLYVGGSFFTIGGQSRKYLAAVDLNGTVSAWNPSPSNIVNVLALGGNTLYVAGLFKQIATVARPGVAAFDTTTLTLSSWDPAPNGAIWAITADANTVYLGGTFTQLANGVREGMGATNAAGQLLPWTSSADGNVRAMAYDGSTVYVGGFFNSIGRKARNNLAALDVYGVATNWDPNALSEVSALATDGTQIYVGGAFTTIGGQSRNYVAAVDATGTVLPWNPGTDGQVLALAVNGTSVYMGGYFSTVANKTRNHIAAVDSGGSLIPWDPNADRAVTSLAIGSNVVYVGGAFTNIGNAARTALAAIDNTGKAIVNWIPNPNATVIYSMVPHGSNLFVTGNFGTIGGANRTGVAELDAAGAVTNWDAGASWYVNGLALSGNTLYTGGPFTIIGGQARTYAAALDRNAKALEWDPKPNQPISVMAINGTSLFVGGTFTTMNLKVRKYFAQFTLPPPPPTIGTIAPASGPTAGGTNITITGTNFQTGLTVAIDGKLATITSVNATEIKALTPAGTAGAKNVLVTNPDLQSDTAINAFTYLLPPVLNFLAPASGPTAGGTGTILNGSNFQNGATVTIDGVAALNVVWMNSTQLSVTTPAGAAGAKTVVVTNPDLQTATLPGGFTFIPPPLVTSIFPTSGTANGGTLLTINGTGLATVATVKIGNVACTNITRMSDTQATAITPMGTAGTTNDVYVQNTDGQATTLAAAYTYTNDTPPTPTVGFISPNHGSIGGGDPITVEGTFFLDGATIWLGNVQVQNVVYVSSLKLTGTTAAGSLGPVNVTVRNPNGQAGTMNLGFTYEAPAPTIQSISPASGSVDGATALTITGTGFITGARVSIGGAAAVNVTVSNSTTITCLSPKGTLGAADVKVTNTDGQSATSTGGYTYTNPNGTLAPTITSISPNVALAAQSTTVRINGTGFQSGARVQFGNSSAASVLFISDQQLEVVTPFSTPQTVDVIVTNPDSGAARMTNGFRFLDVGEAPPMNGTVKVYSNPHSKKEGDVLFATAADAQIKIFDTRGALVRELSGSGLIHWDMKNSGGNEVVTGLYFCLIKSSAGTQKVPLAIKP